MQTHVQRFSVTSAKPFETVVNTLEAAVGHPDLSAFEREVAATRTRSEMEQVVHRSIGTSGLMEFVRFDIGEFLHKGRGTGAPRALRFLIGNPLIMRQMVVHVPDAASYAPVTILIDERADGVHLSYDQMAGFLAPYGNPEALMVARDLDAKIEALLNTAAN